MRKAPSTTAAAPAAARASRALVGTLGSAQVRNCTSPWYAGATRVDHPMSFAVIAETKPRHRRPKETSP